MGVISFGDAMTTQTPPIIYRIRNWDDHFENNRSREVAKLAWVAMPIKQDGDGYTELLSHKDGAAHFGSWCAIVQVAAKCGVRGTLVRDGGRPHDVTSIERLTRIPAKTLECAMERLVSIGWLEACTISQEGAVVPQEGAVLLCPVVSCIVVPPSLPEASQESSDLAEALAASIGTWKPDYRELLADKRERTIARWGTDIDKALRLDRRKGDTMRLIIEWLPAHEGRDGFRWREQVMSGRKLRDHYDKLDIAKNRENASGADVQLGSDGGIT